jgi:YfiH family protein
MELTTSGALSTGPVGPHVLTSRLLSSASVVAGFSTRSGGDDLLALAREGGFDPSRLVMTSQVHGASVVEVGADDRPEDWAGVEADGLVTVGPAVVAVRTADCLPVLMSHPATGVVAAVHAGWRGLVRGVIEQAAQTLCSRAACRPEELVVALGPAIGPCCFEVGDDVAEAIVAAAGEACYRPASAGDFSTVGPERSARPHIDLWRAATTLLGRMGMPARHMEFVGGCTRCSSSLFHSYRRDPCRRGRQVSFISTMNGSR